VQGQLAIGKDTQHSAVPLPTVALAEVGAVGLYLNKLSLESVSCTPPFVACPDNFGKRQQILPGWREKGTSLALGG